MTTKNTSRNDENIGPAAANAADRRHNGVDERRRDKLTMRRRASLTAAETHTKCKQLVLNRVFV